jgi:hypothetical protein
VWEMEPVICRSMAHSRHQKVMKWSEFLAYNLWERKEHVQLTFHPGTLRIFVTAESAMTQVG